MYIESRETFSNPNNSGYNGTIYGHSIESLNDNWTFRKRSYYWTLDIPNRPTRGLNQFTFFSQLCKNDFLR